MTAGRMTLRVGHPLNSPVGQRHRHHGAVGCCVAPELVCDQAARLAALPLQQLTEEACGRTPIAAGLHEDVDHVTVLVHGPPEIPPLPLDGHEEFVQVPRVAQTASPAPQPPRVVAPECLTPVPNRLIRHRDTPFGEEIFDISETQAEAVVEPDGATDDLRWKAVSVVAESRGRHRPTLSAARQLDCRRVLPPRTKPPAVGARFARALPSPGPGSGRTTAAMPLCPEHTKNSGA